MIDEKLKALSEDLTKVSDELEKLTKLKLKIVGAIEILTQMKEEEKDGSSK